VYAAGRSAVGLCSASYVSGLSLADTVYSGRHAAQAAPGRAGRAASAVLRHIEP
jgi:3-oxo-5alpha-steroid 4-dehydrogenase